MVDRGQFTWAAIWARVCFDLCRAIISPFLNSDRRPVAYFVMVVVWEELGGRVFFSKGAPVALLYKNFCPSTLGRLRGYLANPHTQYQFIEERPEKEGP